MREHGAISKDVVPFEDDAILYEKDGDLRIDASILHTRTIEAKRKKNLIAGYKSSTSKPTSKSMSKPTSKSMSKKKKEADPYHQAIIEIYHDWYLTLYSVKPQIQVKDAAAVKKISVWLQSNVLDGSDPLDGFRYVLASWQRLDNFIQSKTDIAQISSNWNQIISQLKKTKRT